MRNFRGEKALVMLVSTPVTRRPAREVTPVVIVIRIIWSSTLYSYTLARSLIIFTCIPVSAATSSPKVGINAVAVPNSA